MRRIGLIHLALFFLVFVSCDLLEADPDETDPTVSLLGLEDSSFVSGTVTFGCSASDNEEIDRTELYIDDVASGIIDDTSPYTFDWATYTYPNETYHTLYVRAWDNSGNAANSDTVTVIIDNTAIFSPTNLVVTTLNNAIELNWEDNSDFEEGYRIERDEGAGFVQLDTVGENNTSYTDTGLEYGLEYSYRVAAFVGNQTSDYTNTASGLITFFNMEWINIPAGEFTFGESDILVDIAYDYEIMQYEVTNSQYVSYLEEALARGDIEVDPESIILPIDSILYCDLSNPESKISWTGSKFQVQAGYDQNPIALVTWEGAKAFSAHYGWRLPTEREWEKAARSTTGWDYPWGDNTPTCLLANYSGCHDGTIAVGLTTGDSYYGVADMVGNVWELTSDLYEGGPLIIAKGGSWNTHTEHLESWFALPVLTSYTHYLIGFRCVRDI